MKKRIHFLLCSFSFILLLLVLACHFRIAWLPLACLLLGLLVRIVFKSSYLEIFSFLIPVLPAFATLGNSGFPLNYLLLPLFFLVGIMAVEFTAGKGKASRPLPGLPRFYSTYLMMLGVSFLFVLLRWSNPTLSPLAFLRDTPVAPTGQRLSFGIIFPVVELALFALSPFYYLLLKRASDLRRILVAFLCGQSLSIFCSLFQRWQGTRSSAFSIRGLASDATAFGFLSALAILIAWYLHFRFVEKRLGFLFAAVSLVGILNSATRVGLFAIVAVMLFFTFFSQKKLFPRILIGVLLVSAFFLYIRFTYQPDFKFLSRIKNTIKMVDRSLETRTINPRIVRHLIAGRTVLWDYSIECLREFPLSGVGAGNFVFWVMSAHPVDFFHHLPANQYFFISSSTGLLGLTAFLLFCFGLLRFKKWPEKWLLGILFFLLIFNDYLWFPEIFLVFWLFASLGEKIEEKPSVFGKPGRILCFCGVLFLIVSNFLNFASLHPRTWARERGVAYDYGLSYPEVDVGRVFRWTEAKAGIFVYQDNDGRGGEYRLFCGAPLASLSGRKQTVDIYWRGRFFKRVVFRRNEEYVLRVEDKIHGEGFLEFRVRPAFNLKRMGLGEETRTLGMQVSGPGI